MTSICPSYHRRAHSPTGKPVVLCLRPHRRSKTFAESGISPILLTIGDSRNVGAQAGLSKLNVCRAWIKRMLVRRNWWSPYPSIKPSYRKSRREPFKPGPTGEVPNARNIRCRCRNAGHVECCRTIKRPNCMGRRALDDDEAQVLARIIEQTRA